MCKLLYNIFKKDPSKKNMYALASISSTNTMNKLKDTRQIRPEFKKLETFMRQPT